MSYTLSRRNGRTRPRRFRNPDQGSVRCSFPIGNEVLPRYSPAALRNRPSGSDTAVCVGSDSVSGTCCRAFDLHLRRSSSQRRWVASKSAEGFQLAVCDISYDFRVVWQSPRSCRLL